MVASLTRLRLRSLRFLPGFAVYATGSIRQMRNVPGFVAGRLLPDRHWAFWTMTFWTDEAALKAWRGAGIHGKSMQKLKHWCDEAGVARWEVSEGSSLPEWSTCHQLLTTTGRLTPVLRPSPAQELGITAVPLPANRPGSPPFTAKGKP